MLKATVSFVMLLATVVSCVTADYAQAKNVAQNFSQPRQTVSSCDNGSQVSELVFRGNCGPNFEDCRPAPSSLPPAFAPPQIAPQPLAPVASPVASVASDVTQNGVVSLFGLVALAIGGGIGTYLGHNKANEDDKKDAEYWASVDDAASSKTKVGG